MLNQPVLPRLACSALVTWSLARHAQGVRELSSAHYPGNGHSFNTTLLLMRCVSLQLLKYRSGKYSPESMLGQVGNAAQL